MNSLFDSGQDYSYICGSAENSRKRGQIDCKLKITGARFGKLSRKQTLYFFASWMYCFMYIASNTGFLPTVVLKINCR